MWLNVQPQLNSSACTIQCQWHLIGQKIPNQWQRPANVINHPMLSAYSAIYSAKCQPPISILFMFCFIWFDTILTFILPLIHFLVIPFSIPFLILHSCHFILDGSAICLLDSGSWVELTTSPLPEFMLYHMLYISTVSFLPTAGSCHLPASPRSGLAACLSLCVPASAPLPAAPAHVLLPLYHTSSQPAWMH